jgi:hypothetical protein
MISSMTLNQISIPGDVLPATKIVAFTGSDLPLGNFSLAERAGAAVMS